VSFGVRKKPNDGWSFQCNRHRANVMIVFLDYFDFAQEKERHCPFPGNHPKWFKACVEKKSRLHVLKPMS